MRWGSQSDRNGGKGEGIEALGLERLERRKRKEMRLKPVRGVEKGGERYAVETTGRVRYGKEEGERRQMGRNSKMTKGLGFPKVAGVAGALAAEATSTLVGIGTRLGSPKLNLDRSS